MNPKECANFTKEFNGEKNWCLIRDTPCPMVEGLKTYMNGIETNHYKPSELNPCKWNGITFEPAGKKPEGKYNKTCKHCKDHFKTDIKNKLYCSDYCKDKANKNSHKKYNRKR